MRCFLKGLFGTILVLIITAIIYPQYSDYRASVETSRWQTAIIETQEYISGKAEHNQSLINSGVGAPKPQFPQNIHPSYFNVTTDGIVFVQGGREGQLIVLVPTISDGKVS